jgi:flagellar biosynthesis regulator FlaF
VCVERLGLAGPGTAAQKRAKAFSEKVDTALPKEKAANTESIDLFVGERCELMVNVKRSKPFGV